MTARTAVRTAGPADLGRIVEVHLAARTGYYRGHLGSAELDRDNAAAAAAWPAHLQPDPDRLVLVAERAGRVIGVAHSGPPHHPEADPVITRELHQLHVDPTVSRSGAGSLLMAATLSTWATAGHRAGRLWVWGFNAPALAFYAAHGWRSDGAARPDTPPIDGHAMIGLRRDDLPNSGPPPA